MVLLEHFSMSWMLVTQRGLGWSLSVTWPILAVIRPLGRDPLLFVGIRALKSATLARSFFHGPVSSALKGYLLGLQVAWLTCGRGHSTLVSVWLQYVYLYVCLAFFICISHWDLLLKSLWDIAPHIQQQSFPVSPISMPVCSCCTSRDLCPCLGYIWLLVRF